MDERYRKRWQKNSDRWIQTEGHETTIYQLRACMGICLFSLGKWDLHQQFNCLGIEFGNSTVFGDKGIEPPFTILTMRWGAALTAPHRHQSPSSAALTAPHRHQSPSSAPLAAPHRHQSPSSAALTAPHRHQSPSSAPLTAPHRHQSPSSAALTAPHRHQSPSSAPLAAPHRHQSPSSAALAAPHRHQSPSSAALTAPRAPYSRQSMRLSPPNFLCSVHMHLYKNVNEITEYIPLTMKISSHSGTVFVKQLRLQTL
jgi:hypothetical protein